MGDPMLEVTCRDLDTGEVGVKKLTDGQHLLITVGRAYIANEQRYPKSGTTQLTVRRGDVTPVAEQADPVDRRPPDGYGWPGPGMSDLPGPVYWLTPQPGWAGRTPLFAVQSAELGAERILAERCYSAFGVQIVDALRAAAVRA